MPKTRVTNEETRGGRERLLEAALLLFSIKGFAATSVRNILAEAKVTAPVLYYHFGNKEGLFQALVQEGLREHERAIDAAIAGPGSATERIRAFCSAMAIVKRKYVALAPTAEAALAGGQAILPIDELRQVVRETHRRLEELVALGVRSGELRPCREATVVLVLLGCVDFSTRMTRLGLNERDETTTLDRMLDEVLAGLTGPTVSRTSPDCMP
jgi:AcrR family transcriptional regulator